MIRTNKIGVIYAIVSKIDGKIYVGQTTKDLEVRFAQHCKSRSNSSYLKHAIALHGKENFAIETLYECYSIEEMNKMEAYYIETLGTLAPNGYNLTSGGIRPSYSSTTRLKMSISATGRTMSAAARSNMSMAQKGKNSKENNPFFGQIHMPGSIAMNIQKHNVAIICNETKTIYESGKQASGALKISASSICQVLKGKRKSAGGYTFSYLEGK